MVTPPALMAATPVGATTAICLEQFCRMDFKKVFLLVPALPVRKILRQLWLMRSTAIMNIVLKAGKVECATILYPNFRWLKNSLINLTTSMNWRAGKITLAYDIFLPESQ